MTRPVDHLRSALNAQGYKSAAPRRVTSHPIVTGCALALHFGDRLSATAEGRELLTIRACLELGGQGSGPADVIHCRIQKQDLRPIAPGWAALAIEIDVFLAGELITSEISLHAARLYAHLQRLVQDAYAMLERVPVDEIGPPNMAGPVVRIEARLLGDIAAGRSGLAAANRPRMSARHRQVSQAACEWLMDTVMPELAGAVRTDWSQNAASSRADVPATPGSRHTVMEPIMSDRADLIFPAVAESGRS
ncbi:MAG TPA: hypothetical protein VKV77_02330 [Methylovirgula sp.]|nr:hypothetical protein [Methylovirgula sp.]